MTWTTKHVGTLNVTKSAGEYASFKTIIRYVLDIEWIRDDLM